jgi:hypothetical protein
MSDLSTQYTNSEIMNQLSYHVSNNRFRGMGFNFQGNLKKGIGDTINLLKALI